MTNLFIRQPITESTSVEYALIQEVIDIIAGMIKDTHIQLLTGTQVLQTNTYDQLFEQLTGTPFSPKAFRDYRFSLLDKTDLIINIRTGLSESSAFELAYNIFRGKKAPVLFCCWERSPLKTTLLRDLQDLCDISYVSFSNVSDLTIPIQQFIKTYAQPFHQSDRQSRFAL